MKNFIEQRYNLAFYEARMDVDIFSVYATSAIVPGSDVSYNASLAYVATGKHIYIGLIPVPKNCVTNNEIPAPYTTSTDYSIPEINTTEYLKSQAIQLMNSTNYEYLKFINHNSIVQKEGRTYRRCFIADAEPYLDSARYNIYTCVLEIHEELDGE